MYIFTTPPKVSSHHIGDTRNTLFSPVYKVAILFFHEQNIIGVSFITDFWTPRLNERETAEGISRPSGPGRQARRRAGRQVNLDVHDSQESTSGESQQQKE